jgi:hypothetical protein
MAHPLAKHRDNGPFLMWGQRDADLLFVHMAPTYNEVRHKEIGQDFKFLMSVVNQAREPLVQAHRPNLRCGVRHTRRQVPR